MFCTERLNDEVALFLFVRQLQPHFRLVAPPCTAQSLVGQRWIENRLDKHVASFVA